MSQISDRKKRIAILGTSNSIMRDGWAAHFIASAPKDWEVTNFSLGGNCSLFMLGQQELNEIAANYDLCIIELFVNDQRYIDTAHFRDDYFAATLTGLLAQFARAPNQRCAPLVLSLPKRNSLAAPRYFDSCALTISRVCSYLGVATFDVGEILRAACTSTRRMPEDFFNDGLHLKPAAQRHISAALIRRLGETWPGMPSDANELFAFAPVFATVGAGEFTSEATTTMRETSLSKYPVIGLGEGETLRIASPEAIRRSGTPYFCGILHWANPYADLVRFQALGAKKSSVQKLLRKAWQIGIFFFTHLSQPMEVGEGIEIKSGGSRWRRTEPSINPASKPGAAPMRNEIAYAVFCDRNPDIAGAAIRQRVADLPVTNLAGFDAVLANQLRVIPLDG